MPNEIKYDFSYLDDAISEVSALKNNLPAKKGSSYKWSYLYTGKSKGDVLDTLVNLANETEERSRQIEELIDNVLFVLKNAKEQMKRQDERLSKEFKGK